MQFRPAHSLVMSALRPLVGRVIMTRAGGGMQALFFFGIGTVPFKCRTDNVHNGLSVLD